MKPTNHTTLNSLAEILLRSVYAFCLVAPLFSRIPFAATIAAQQSTGYPRWQIISISGPIEQGDHSQFLQAAAHSLVALKNDPLTEGVIVRIDSSGGSVVEAINIGRAIRKMRLYTAIGTQDARFGDYGGTTPEQRQCFSACFFILSGGVSRGGPWINRTAEIQLGVHRPYFEQSYFSGLTAPEAETEYSRLQATSRAFLLEMGVSESFVHRMFSVPSNDVWMVSQDEFRQEVGNVPFYEEWFIASCGDNLTEEESDSLLVHELRKQGNKPPSLSDMKIGGKVISEEDARRAARESADSIIQIYEEKHGKSLDFPDSYIDYLEKKSSDLDSCRKETRKNDQISAMQAYLKVK